MPDNMIHTILIAVWEQNVEEIVSVFKKLKKSFKENKHKIKQNQVKYHVML